MTDLLLLNLSRILNTYFHPILNVNTINKVNYKRKILVNDTWLQPNEIAPYSPYMSKNANYYFHTTAKNPKEYQWNMCYVELSIEVNLTILKKFGSKILKMY